MSDIRLVHGPEVKDVLEEEGKFALFSYGLNKPVFGLTLIIGGALLALAGMMWWNSQLTSPGWIAGFSVLTTLGIGLGALAAYWYVYTETHFLAMSEETVFVGKRDRMWAIGWPLLDRESLGFEDMALSSTGGTLEIDVAGQQIPVRLYNSFVHLEDIQGFMFRILQHLKEEDEAEEDATQ